MNFKDPERFKREFWEIDQRLRQIICDMEVLTYPELMTITCLVRSEEENRLAGASTLIHCVGRAADVRLFKKEDTNDMIVNTINQMYVYDPRRPNLKTIIRHKVDGGADHLHVQVRPINDIHKELGLAII